MQGAFFVISGCTLGVVAHPALVSARITGSKGLRPELCCAGYWTTLRTSFDRALSLPSASNAVMAM
jgi:hypothetical protein